MTQAVIPQWRLCDRLARALDESHLTVQQMADILGVDRNTVGNYLHGRTRPRDAVLRVWAMETGVDFDRLVDAGCFISEALGRRTGSRAARARLAGRERSLAS
jgi:transcriptional regulator with XRE-family HTH domain